MPPKIEKITIPPKRNLDALFFDIATQALDGFDLENDLFFQHGTGKVGALNMERKTVAMGVSGESL